MEDAGNRKRQEARRLLQELKERGYAKVRIEGDPENDLVDVCRLTYLEQKIIMVNSRRLMREDKVPVLRVAGQELSLKWPEEGENG